MELYDSVLECIKEGMFDWILLCIAPEESLDSIKTANSVQLRYCFLDLSCLCAF